jgi:hypothetical protein
LGTGQALVTVLNEKGIPTEVSATMLTPPRAVMGPLTAADFDRLVQDSPMYAKYKDPIDPESAYDILTKRINEQTAAAEQEKQEADAQKQAEKDSKPKPGEKSLVEQVMGATITRQIGKEIVRGIFGMLTGKKTRSKTGGGLFGF